MNEVMAKTEVVEGGNMFEIVAPAPQSEITPMALLQMATSQGADLDRLEKLMDMQLRWEENAARKAYHEAVSLFKGEDIKIIRDARVHFTSSKGTTDYRHETLGQVVSQVAEPMSKHGLSNSWDVHQNGNQVTVICRLSHRLGHSETVSMTAGADNTGNKNSIQQIGSTTTYLQRYTLKAILGLATVDDDGQGGSEQNSQTERPIYMETVRFNAAFIRWEKMVLAGEKTAQDIIAAAGEKNINLSPEQIKSVKSIGR